MKVSDPAPALINPPVVTAVPPLSVSVVPAVATSIVGNNQNAVRALLDSYHRIDGAQTDASLWIEAESARQWMRSTSGDDIAANRAAVLDRGRAQVAVNSDAR